MGDPYSTQTRNELCWLENTKRKRQLKEICIKEDNIKMGLGYILWEYMGWISLAQNTPLTGSCENVTEKYLL
jgi:hypothetical protein